MHRTTITESVLGTVVLFNTVFQMPEEPAILQIINWLLVFFILIICIEEARILEKRVKKKARQAATKTDQ